MKSRLLFLPLIALALAVAGMATAKTSRQQGVSPERQKARYYYLEGLRHQGQEEAQEAYEYFKRATAIDPTYTEAASAYATQRISLRLDTMRTPAELNRSLAMLRPFVDKYPDDANEALYYSLVAQSVNQIPEAIRVLESLTEHNPQLSSAYAQLAEAYMRSGETEMAIETFNRLETIDGKSIPISLTKISYRLHSADTVGAVAEAKAIMDANPANPQCRILMGNMMNLVQKKDSALLYFEEAEKLNPDLGAAKLALADFYLQQGDSAQYDAKTYEALISEDFGLDEKLDLMTRYIYKILSEKNNMKRSDHLFEVLRQQFPHEPEMLNFAAQYSAAKGDFKDAAEQIGYAIDLSPSDMQLRAQMMSYLISDDRAEEAMKYYDDFKKQLTPPRRLTALYAAAAQIAHHTDTAINAYKNLIREINSNFPTDSVLTARMIPASVTYDDMLAISELYTSIGDCYYADKRLQEAYNAYDNALTLNPDNAMALNNYAYFLSENGGDLERAAEMSLKSLDAQNSSNPTFLDTYAWILHKKGDEAEALKYQTSAIEEAEKQGAAHSELYDHYGDILKENDKDDEALEAYEKALEHEDKEDARTKLEQKIKALKNVKK
ncbi:MAG: tetratricopeptide repeat protein [Muribaculaceae bacterium]|nr:tetratricopeptide repeat protein [Muribaculaceae bacterium]